VKFANIAVSVLSYTDTVIAVSIPYGLLNNPGTYLVSISRGSTPEENSTLGVTVGQQGSKGEKGDMGPAGPKGDSGAKGATGDTGPTHAPTLQSTQGRCGS
jgi:hypothetical protein